MFYRVLLTQHSKNTCFVYLCGFENTSWPNRRVNKEKSLRKQQQHFVAIHTKCCHFLDISLLLMICRLQIINFAAFMQTF